MRGGRLGLVPLYRFQWTSWTERMRAAAVRALASLRGVAVIAPVAAP